MLLHVWWYKWSINGAKVMEDAVKTQTEIWGTVIQFKSWFWGKEMNLEDFGCGWVISQFSFRFFFALQEKDMMSVISLEWIWLWVFSDSWKWKYLALFPRTSDQAQLWQKWQWTESSLRQALSHSLVLLIKMIGAFCSVQCFLTSDVTSTYLVGACSIHKLFSGTNFLKK